MSENIPVSAFSMYAKKRKNTEQQINCKKSKNKHLLSEVSNQKNIKQMVVKQKPQKQQNKDKYTVNISVKSKDGIVTKKGNLRICKHSSLPTAKPIKITNKLKRIQQLSTINNVQSMHERSKLKVTKKQKEKTEKKTCDKRKTIATNKTTLRENAEKENNDSHSNYIELHESTLNEQKNITYFGGPNPILNSQKLFEWLIHPLEVKNFFTLHWEKTPTHVKRNKSDYYKWIISTCVLDKILRDNHILFTKNIDITSYFNGVRETHNPSGRAFPSVVWDYYLNDCSVRMLNPQTFIPQLHALNATLQEFFGCFVGANLYLTPPNSQGFAPHYDDIEAFILQIEGKKRWRLYMPPNENEYLPRCSSKNFDQSEIGEPILDTIVSAGDLLYLPRGTIHQGTTIDNTHSLHVTLSVYQKNSWCNLLEKLLPQALKRATETNSHFREGLPLEYLRYTGIAHSTSTTEYKEAFKEKIKDLIINLLNYIDVDSAADLMAKDHIHDFLPPFLTKDEQKCSVAEDGEIMTSNGIVKNCTNITPEIRIRLLRMHCIRLIEEDGIYRIYYSTENSKEYHEYEAQFLEIDAEFVPGIQKIIISYPNFICVKELPIENDDIKGTCTHSMFSFASSGPRRIYPLPAVYRVLTDKLTDLTLMDRPWSDVSSTEIGHVGANEISRDDVNVIHIFCIFSQQYVTLPPVRALGKTRKGGKKKKTPMERERNNVYIYVYTSMCEIKRRERKRKSREAGKEEENDERNGRANILKGWGRGSR